MSDTAKPIKPRARATKTSTAPASAKPVQAASAPTSFAGPTKSATVVKLLLRAKGATPLELIAATDWQPHSVRAFLSGLRKKGRVLTREPRKSGEAAYRIIVVATDTAGDDRAPVDIGAAIDGGVAVEGQAGADPITTADGGDDAGADVGTPAGDNSEA